MKPLALVIEDEEDIAELYGHLLRLLGFEAEHKYNTEDARSRLAECEPQMVILDLRLGTDSAGPELLQYIRSEQRLRETHVVVISGYPRLAQMIGESADIVLMKPVDMRQLAGLIMRLSWPATDSRNLHTDIENYLLDLETLTERISINFERARAQTNHTFALIGIHLQPDQTIGGVEYTGGTQELIERAAVRRIQRRLRLADMAARTAENEFLVMLHEIHEPEDAMKVASRLTGALDESFLVDSDKITARASCGIVVSSPGYDSADEMVAVTLATLRKAVENGEPMHIAIPPE